MIRFIAGIVVGAGVAFAAFCAWALKNIRPFG